jgi:hypothetical protein
MLRIQILADADWITCHYVTVLVTAQLIYTRRICAECQGVIPWNALNRQHSFYVGTSSLVVFEKLRKATIGFDVLVSQSVSQTVSLSVNLSVCQSVCLFFCMSICLSFGSEQLGSYWTDFHLIWYLSIFLKCGDKIKVLYKSDKHKGYFTCRPMYIYHSIPLNSSYNENCYRKVLWGKSKHKFSVQ